MKKVDKKSVKPKKEIETTEDGMVQKNEDGTDLEHSAIGLFGGVSPYAPNDEIDQTGEKNMLGLPVKDKKDSKNK